MFANSSFGPIERESNGSQSDENKDPTKAEFDFQFSIRSGITPRDYRVAEHVLNFGRSGDYNLRSKSPRRPTTKPLAGRDFGASHCYPPVGSDLRFMP